MFKIFDVIAIVLMLSSVAFGVGPSLSGTGLDMNGYKVSDMLNGTSNQDAITYSQLIASVSAISSNEYVFTGTTGSELHTFIDTYGPGTYILANPITITSTLTIDQNHVIIKGLAHGTNIYSSSLGGYIGINMASGLAINVTGQQIVLEDLCFDLQNDASTAIMVQLSGIEICITDCEFYNSKGTALMFESGAYLSRLEKSIFGSNTEHYGIFVVFQDTISYSAVHPLDIYIEDVYAFNSLLAFDLRSCEGIYMRDIETYHCDSGLAFNPVGGPNVYNIQMDFVILDSCRNGGTCLYSTGAYSIYNIIIDQPWFYSEPTASRAVLLMDVDQVSITDGFISGSGEYNMIYVHSDCNGVIINSNYIRLDSAITATAIYNNGADNVIITNNRIRAPSGGYSIAMISGSDSYIVKDNLVCSDPTGATDSTHIIKDNINIGTA